MKLSLGYYLQETIFRKLSLGCYLSAKLSLGNCRKLSLGNYLQETIFRILSVQKLSLGNYMKETICRKLFVGNYLQETISRKLMRVQIYSHIWIFIFQSETKKCRKHYCTHKNVHTTYPLKRTYYISFKTYILHIL